MTAVITTIPEMSVPALVMNCLAPSITHSPSSSLARVLVLPASEPASGSVSPNAPSFLPAHSSRHPLLLLLLGAEQVDRLGAQRGVGAQRDGHRGVHPRELLHRQRVGQRVAARAAVLLGERDAHQVQLAQLGDQVVGDRLGPIQLLGHRRHLALGEVADGAADQLVVVREVEIHVAAV